MYVFIDESGDLGTDFDNKKPSKFFVITLLICETNQALKTIKKSIEKTLKRKLNCSSKSPKDEIKGTNTTLKIKQYFYNQIAHLDDIQIYSVILNKKRLTSQIQKIDQHRIYLKMCYIAFENVGIKSDCTFAQIIADRCKSGIEAKDFSHSLRAELEKRMPFTSKIVIEQLSSKDDYGLQAVDLFSYGIFHKHEFGRKDWHEIYENKINSETLI